MLHHFLYVPYTEITERGFFHVQKKAKRRSSEIQRYTEYHILFYKYLALGQIILHRLYPEDYPECVAAVGNGIFPENTN
jgi:hypothetical protein